MRSSMHVAAGLAAGAVGWTFTEYATHRWLLHGPFGKGSAAESWVGRIPLGGIHRNHHRDPNWSVLWGRAAGHVAIAATAAAGARAVTIAAPTLPAGAVAAAAATWSAGYSTYDIVHHALHHREPRTALGIRMRRRHFRHHFAGARTNLGVTMSWWDRVFATEAPDEPVRVPANAAPAWLEALGTSFSSGARTAAA